MRIMRTANIAQVVGAAVALAASSSALAQPGDRAIGRSPARAERPTAVGTAQPRPQWERDGVSGNDAFNNQLRKFSDPIGAHGGR